MIDRLVRHAVTLLLVLYWATAFMCLSAVCVADLERGLPRALALLGFSSVPTSATFHGIAPAAAFGVLCGIAAIMFFWGLVTLCLSSKTADAESVLQLAYLVGGGVLVVLLVITASYSVPSALTVLAIQLAALAVSYMAMHSERAWRSRSARDQLEVERTSASQMASNAARTYTNGDRAQVLPFTRWPKGSI
jgi:hypothetical protein